MNTKLTVATLALTGLIGQHTVLDSNLDKDKTNQEVISVVTSSFSADIEISSANCQCPICTGSRLLGQPAPHIAPVQTQFHLPNLPNFPTGI